MKNKDALAARLAWLIGLKDCNELFKKELGKTPYEVISERGAYITDYESLTNPDVQRVLGISNEQALELQRYRDSSRPDASTLTKNIAVGMVTLFNEKEINVSWLGSFFYGPIDWAKIDEAVPHEAVHLLGKGEDRYPSMFSYNHDLNNWKPYKEVVDKCKIPLP